MDNHEWLAILKVGDKVIVLKYALGKQFSSGVITKITDKKRDISVKEDGSERIRVFNNQGREKNSSSHYHPANIVEPNEETLAEMKKSQEEYAFSAVCYFLNEKRHKFTHEEKLEVIDALGPILQKIKKKDASGNP